MYVLLTHSIGPYLMKTNYVRCCENWFFEFVLFEWNFELLYGDIFLSFNHKKRLKLLISSKAGIKGLQKDRFLYNPTLIIDNHIIYRLSCWHFSMFFGSYNI